MTLILPTALAYSRRGFPVVPLWWPTAHPKTGKQVCACHRATDCSSAAKHPHGPTAPHGLRSATTDSDIIKHWFSIRVPQANLGVVIPAGIVVLDFDPRHGGELSDFEKENGDLPPSWRVQTGSGGWHCYFRLPAGITLRSEKYNPQAAHNGTTFPGVDILVEGSYVVAVPSKHVCGRSYAWSVDHHPADVDMAEAPTWLIERLEVADRAQPVAGKSDANWRNVLTGQITECRDAAAVSVAGLALSRIRHVPNAWHFLRTWNAIAPKPPLSEAALWKIFDRIAAREMEKSTWQ